MSKKLISIISPCYNEESNVQELYARVKGVMSNCPEYNFEYLFIDNASTDGTVQKLKDLINKGEKIKIIVNTRNFGHIRSPYWGLIQTTGDATIYLASDLQDPPELIPRFLEAWNDGYKVVLAIKPTSQSNKLMHFFRRTYYKLLNLMSDISITPDSTGFGLYDQSVIVQLRKINDPYPFLRGLINELGYKIKTIAFNQPRRLKGLSKNNFFTLYDIAILGVISHSRMPIRAATLIGFFFSVLSMLVGGFFLVYKIIYWKEFALGVAPIVIGMFFMFGILMAFIGLLGEYIGSIHTYVQGRPVVVEEERINF